jgi:hypothetical protein
MTDGSPCRLSVYLATDAPRAAVLRRGPSDWVRLSLWHTDDDGIEHGQWMAGRVYERRCDLSPDGSLFAYFVRKDTAHTASEVGADSWVAVSRPPWFMALALWAIGGTYCTGAYFVDGRSLFLGGTHSPPDRGALPDWLTPVASAPFLDHTNDWTDRTVQFNRLLRGGWRPVPDERATLPWWEHASSDGRRTLVMMERADGAFTSYGGRHVVEYAVRSEPDGGVEDIGRATWADWDHRGRLMMARDGVLGEWRGSQFVPLVDFNGDTPDPATAPAEALMWPLPPGAN